jgi:hypothetical protein
MVLVYKCYIVNQKKLLGIFSNYTHKNDESIILPMFILLFSPFVFEFVHSNCFLFFLSVSFPGLAKSK